jgi:hypothetical protein
MSQPVGKACCSLSEQGIHAISTAGYIERKILYLSHGHLNLARPPSNKCMAISGNAVWTEWRWSNPENENSFSGWFSFYPSNIKAGNNRLYASPSGIFHSRSEIMDTRERRDLKGTGWFLFGFIYAEDQCSALRIGKGYNLAE